MAARIWQLLRRDTFRISADSLSATLSLPCLNRREERVFRQKTITITIGYDCKAMSFNDVGQAELPYLFAEICLL
jgi:hypothetical protein